MSAVKKQASSSPAPAWLRNLFSWLLGRGRPMLVVAVLIGLFGGGWYWTWRRIGPRILGSPEYRVGPEQVEITPLPPWIHSDIRAEVFRSPSLDGPLSILDADLAERIYKAFTQCAWVAKVVSVTKSHPALVKVELTYRKPVGMVEVRGGVLPVDSEGVLLPQGDFSPIEATRYPRLVGAEREPAGPPGRSWGDAAVVGGAEIAAALSPQWETMKLSRILAVKAPGGVLGRPGEPTFVLETRSGTRIVWGYAPGALNTPGEMPAADKVARLRHYLDEHDTFDGPQGQRQKLDVHTMRSPLRP